MNVFHKVTLQGLKKNRTRTIVTIVGVILSAAMITAVTTFVSSLQHYLVGNVIESSGDWHVKFSNVDMEFTKKRSSDKEVKNSALTQDIGYSLLNGGKNDHKPYLFITAFSEEAFQMTPIRLLTGRLPQNDHELVVSEHIETNGGVSYKPGDELTLEVGSRVLEDERLGQGDPYNQGEEEGGAKEAFVPEGTNTYTVVGVCARPDFEKLSAPGYSAITRIHPSFTDSSDHFNLYVKLKRPREVYDYSERVGKGYGYTFNSELLRFLGVSNNDNFNTVLYSLGGILIALIMVGSILLIHNSFSISVSERTRQFGILSSVGATKKQLRKTVLFEGVCIGFIGIPLGILAGVGGIGVTLSFVSGIFEDMTSTGIPLSLSVSGVSIAVAGIVGIATILISAYIPARKASKLSAIDAIRQTTDVKINAKKIKTSKPAKALFGLEGILALKNLKRNKKRYRSTVISLFVSIVLFVSASAFGMYLKQGTEKSVSSMGYDLSITSDDINEDEKLIRIYETLRNVNGVYDGGYQCFYHYFSTVPKTILSDRYLEFCDADASPEDTLDANLFIHFIDDHTYLNYIHELGLDADEYTGENAKFVATEGINGYDPDTKRISSFDMFKEKEGSLSLRVRPFLTSDEGESAEKNITVTFADKGPKAFDQTRQAGLTVFIPYSLISQFELPLSYDKLTLAFLSTNPSLSAVEMQSALKEMGVHSGYYLYNVAEMQKANRNLLLVINVFTYGFIVLISMITIANVFNTITTNIHLRRREFAILGSVGMNHRGFNKMMNYECVFYGLKALLYGLPTSFLVTYLIYKGVLAGVDVPFNMPWLSVGISVFSVFFVVFVTMLYSIGKVKRENTVDALKNEM